MGYETPTGLRQKLGLTELDQTELAYLDGVVAGTRSNSKAIVVDSSGTIDAMDIDALSMGGVLQTSTPLEVDQACDRTVRTQELVASGAITAGIQSIELNHISTIIASTVASGPAMEGLVIFKNTSASGTAAHTVTLTGGTFNAAGNTVATLNAPDEALAVYFDSNGDGIILINIGSVGLA